MDDLRLAELAGHMEAVCELAEALIASKGDDKICKTLADSVRRVRSYAKMLEGSRPVRVIGRDLYDDGQPVLATVETMTPLVVLVRLLGERQPGRPVSVDMGGRHCTVLVGHPWVRVTTEGVG